MQARIASVLGLVSTPLGLLAIGRAIPRELAGLFPLGFFCGVAGLVLALIELSAIALGKSPPSGRRPARLAVAVSLGHAALLVLFFLGIAIAGVAEGLSRARR